MIPMARPVAEDDDVEAVVAVLRSGQWAAGPEVTRFEGEFADWLGVKHAVAVTNGTVALHAALVAAGVGPGDEVVTTPFTFVASSNAALHAGARPVFADVVRDGFVLDPDDVDRVLGEHPRAKAVVAVHLYGEPCDTDALADVCRRRGVALVEDCAQSHGASVHGRKTGGLGDVGTFSFYATKNLATGEGGAVTTNDDALAARLRRIVNHGRSGAYEHAELGWNHRMTSLVAALGRRQLAKVDARNARRRAIAARYREEIVLPDVVHPSVREGVVHAWHQYTLRVSDRDALQRHLAAEGVASAVFYPLLAYEQPAYRDLGLGGSCPNAADAARRVLSVPVHAGLSDDEVSAVVRAVTSWRG